MEALADYEQVLAYEPQNREAREEIRKMELLAPTAPRLPPAGSPEEAAALSGIDLSGLTLAP